MLTASKGELRLYMSKDGTLNELLWNNATWLINGKQLAGFPKDTVPDRASSGFTLKTNMNVSPPPDFAAQSFSNFAKTLVVVRESEGGIKAHNWNNETWLTDLDINFTNGPSNPKFGYIAMNADGRFYGTEDGKIHEYAWYAGEPTKFLYVAPVGLPNLTSTTR
jgi:hypothetical protein